VPDHGVRRAAAAVAFYSATGRSEFRATTQARQWYNVPVSQQPPGPSRNPIAALGSIGLVGCLTLSIFIAIAVFGIYMTIRAIF
jgi:hypothetical protein